MVVHNHPRFIRDVDLLGLLALMQPCLEVQPQYVSWAVREGSELEHKVSPDLLGNSWQASVMCSRQLTQLGLEGVKWRQGEGRKTLVTLIGKNLWLWAAFNILHFLQRTLLCLSQCYSKWLSVDCCQSVSHRLLVHGDSTTAQVGWDTSGTKYGTCPWHIFLEGGIASLGHQTAWEALIFVTEWTLHVDHYIHVLACISICHSFLTCAQLMCMK